MTKSESIVKLSKALATFHKEVTKIKKTAKNPFFKSSYAPLPEILESISEPMDKAGLVISQHPSGANELTTLLIHAESGEYLESSYQINPAKQDPQALGSAITYARRYAIGAILNLNIDEDDDAEKAMDRDSKPKELPWLNAGTKEWDNVVKYFVENPNPQWSKVFEKFKLSKENQQKIEKQALEILNK